MATKLEKDDRKTIELTFSIGAEVPPDQSIEPSAYVFSAGGELLATQPRKDGTVRLNIAQDDLRKVRLLIGPVFHKECSDKPTIAALERVNAHEPLCATLRFGIGH